MVLVEGRFYNTDNNPRSLRFFSLKFPTHEEHTTTALHSTPHHNRTAQSPPHLRALGALCLPAPMAVGYTRDAGPWWRVVLIAHWL